MIIYKGLNKSEFAEDAGVSPATVRKWFKDCQKQLLELVVTAKSKRLTPGAVKFLCEKYVVVPRNAQFMKD